MPADAALLVRPSPRQTTLRVLGTLVLAYGGLCVVARLGYRVLLYPAPSDPTPISPPGTTMLALQAGDGVAVRALQFPPSHDNARTIVVFHGNGETIATGVDLAEDLRRRGLGVVLVEYRGYGVSRDAARPSEDGLYLDAEAVLDALQTQGIGPPRIVLLGMSLGTGVATEMVRRGRAASLVLVSPYTSIVAMARRTFPFLPVAWLCPDKFDTLSKARHIRVPTLVVHGDADEVVPVAMGRTVAEAISGATLNIIAGGHHNDLFASPGSVLDAIARHASM